MNHEKLLNVSNRRVHDDWEKLLVSVVPRPSLNVEWLESLGPLRLVSIEIHLRFSLYPEHFYFLFRYTRGRRPDDVVTCQRMSRYDLNAAPATVQHVAHDFTTRCRKTVNGRKRKSTRHCFQKYGDTLNFMGFNFVISLYDFVCPKVN